MVFQQTQNTKLTKDKKGRAISDAPKNYFNKYLGVLRIKLFPSTLILKKSFFFCETARTQREREKEIDWVPRFQP